MIKSMRQLINIYIFAVVSVLLVTSTACSPDKKTAGTVIQTNTPDESLYQLPGTWQTQNGDTLHLSKLQGKIPVVSMIFTRCTFACPRIVADLKKIQKQVPAEKKDQVVFVLVSFDSERDNPKKLKAFAEEMKLDNNWILLHGNSEAVREMSMLLDVKYKKQPDGSFSHSNVITLLDTGGSIAAHIEGLGVDPEPLVSRINDL